MILGQWLKTLFQTTVLLYFYSFPSSLLLTIAVLLIYNIVAKNDSSWKGSQIVHSSHPRTTPLTANTTKVNTTQKPKRPTIPAEIHISTTTPGHILTEAPPSSRESFILMYVFAGTVDGENWLDNIIFILLVC